MSEITPSLVYWITRLDYVRTWLFVLVALCAIAIVLLVAEAMNAAAKNDEINELKKDVDSLDPRNPWGHPPYEKVLESVKREVASIALVKDAENRAWRILRNVVVLLLTSIVGLVFTPTTKEMCAIIVIPKIANTEIVQKDLPKAVESVVKIAQNYLEELADIKKEDVK